jgi:hypothetical protein
MPEQVVNLLRQNRSGSGKWKDDGCASSSENTKREGFAAKSPQAGTIRSPQELQRPRSLPRPPVQTGPSNSRTLESKTEKSSPVLPERLEPLRRVPSPVEENPEEESRGQVGAATVNTFAGRTAGEVSNLLSEVGSLTGNATVGKVGESLFAVGGIWQTGAAAGKFSNILGSNSSPEQKKQLLLAGLDLMKGLSNAVSGITGVQGLKGSPPAGKISSVTWALSEGTNALMQGYEAIVEGESLSPQWIAR